MGLANRENRPVVDKNKTWAATPLSLSLQSDASLSTAIETYNLWRVDIFHILVKSFEVIQAFFFFYYEVLVIPINNHSNKYILWNLRIYKTYWQRSIEYVEGMSMTTIGQKTSLRIPFITVWKKLDTFRKESAISTWIYRIAVNNCLRQIEKETASKI
jgi:hypothetical protein